MATLLEKIAAEVSPELGSVDWDALEAEFRMPRAEVVYHTGTAGQADGGLFAYQEYINAAYNRANASLANIRLTWQIEDNPATSENEIKLSMEAWEKVQKETVAIGDTVLHALRSNIQFLSTDKEFVVEKELLRAMVSSTYMTCLYGAVAHAKGIMQLSDVAPEDIINSADSITKTFNALAQMADMGVLDPLKDSAAPAVTPPVATEEVVSTQGLGAVPVAVVVAIAAVVGVGLIAWCIIEVVKQQATNRAIDLMCQEAVKSGEQADLDRCLELVKINKTSQQGGPLGDLAISLGQAALMIGVGYAIFMFAPIVVRILSDRQTRKASAPA